MRLFRNLVFCFLLILRGGLTSFCENMRMKIPHNFNGGFRFLQINDVYTVKYLPRIATALKVHQRQDNIPLIFVFPGDLLTKLEGIEEDYGQTMIRVLNAFDISYGIISVGNHEDMEIPKLLQRIEESKFLWLGSNFADFPSTSTSCLSRSIILEMNDVPTLGFLGLLLNDPKAYGKNPFGGVKILDPLETIPSLIDEIHQQVSESLPMIALTHLETEYDIRVAQTGNFVISFGAHDHNIYKEDVIHNKGITSVVKPGYDAKNFTLVDMIWPSMNPTEQPNINIRIFDSLDYEPDAEVQKLVDAIPLDPAGRVKLFQIPADMKDSSTEFVRFQTSQLASFLLQYLVDALEGKADLALMGGGMIRGKKFYPPGSWYTYGHLKDEFPFTNNKVMILSLPGELIQRMIDNSRLHPKTDGAFLHVSENVHFYPNKEDNPNQIHSINGELFDPVQIYRVVMNSVVLEGVDGYDDLLNYFQMNKNQHSNEENIHSIEIVHSNFQQFYLHYFAKEFLKDMLLSPPPSITPTFPPSGFISSLSSLSARSTGFSHLMDVNQNQKIEINELSNFFKMKYPEIEPSFPILSSMLQLLGSTNSQDKENAFVEEIAFHSFYEKITNTNGTLMGKDQDPAIIITSSLFEASEERVSLADEILLDQQAIPPVSVDLDLPFPSTASTLLSS